MSLPKALSVLLGKYVDQTFQPPLLGVPLPLLLLEENSLPLSWTWGWLSLGAAVVFGGTGSSTAPNVASHSRLTHRRMLSTRAAASS